MGAGPAKPSQNYPMDTSSLLLWTRALSSSNAASFSVDAVLGQGSFGIVFRCRPPEHVQKLGLSMVAVKCLFNYGHTTSRVRNAFESEYKMLTTLPFHPHIVQLLAHFVDAPTDEMLSHFPTAARELAVSTNRRTGAQTPLKTQFVVMQYHPFTLEHVLESKGQDLTKEEILQFSLHVGSALNFLGQRGVVHRDVKLSNILFDEERQAAVLCDFGLACAVDRGMVEFETKSQPGGNTSHLAPEVLNGHHALQERAGRVDFSAQAAFEFGLICYEIAVGEHPFGSYPVGCGSPGSITVGQVDLSGLAATTTADFAELVQALCSDKPSHRPSLQEALHRIAVPSFCSS